MLQSKTFIRSLIAQGNLTEAAAEALRYAEYCGLSEQTNQLVGLQARLTDHIGHWSGGRSTYEEYAREQAKITYELVGLLDQLPAQPKPGAGKKQLTGEEAFKKRLFYFLVISKVLVISRLWYHSGLVTGGFSKAETFATMALLAPVFFAYLPTMLADYIRAYREDLPPRKRYVSGPLVTTAYWLFPVYTIILIYIIELKAKTDFTFAEMNTALSGVEAILGGYVGQIVSAFFKKE